MHRLQDGVPLYFVVRNAFSQSDSDSQTFEVMVPTSLLQPNQKSPKPMGLTVWKLQLAALAFITERLKVVEIFQSTKEVNLLTAIPLAGGKKAFT